MEGEGIDWEESILEGEASKSSKIFVAIWCVYVNQNVPIWIVPAPLAIPRVWNCIDYLSIQPKLILKILIIGKDIEVSLQSEKVDWRKSDFWRNIQVLKSLERNILEKKKFQKTLYVPQNCNYLKKYQL